MKSILTVVTLFLSLVCKAEIPIKLSIQGKYFNVEKKITLGDPGTKNSTHKISFLNTNNEKYTLYLDYKNLPNTRSFPTNIDLTIKKGKRKLGYLFFALNSLDYLKKIGSFGIKFLDQGEVVDIHLFTENRSIGSISFNKLNFERFFQDTLLPLKNFQMIRPVIVPIVAKNVRSKEFNLDNHPYSVEYKILNKGSGIVEFQHNFYHGKYRYKKMLFQVYFTASSIKNLREAMFAAKVFGFKDAPAKLVFYPALGQTEASK